MAQFASGVTIVTAWDGAQQPVGLTASAFTSVSLSPPLVLVCVAHNAQSYAALRAAERFAVNILAASQETLSNSFATSKTNSAEKFVGVTYHPGRLGLPVLDDAVARSSAARCTPIPGAITRSSSAASRPPSAAPSPSPCSTSAGATAASPSPPPSPPSPRSPEDLADAHPAVPAACR